MIYIRPHLLLFYFIVISTLLAPPTSGQTQGRQPLPDSEEQGSASGRRPRIPDRVTCPRNNLTSFTGRVLSFSRTNVRTVIRMRTDEDTTEKFTLHHPKSNDAKKWFLLRGKPFEGSDWALIESARNRLWPNMRATVWVCDDGTSPIVDWQPPNGGENLPLR